MSPISPKTLQDKIASGAAVRVIDVRTPAEFATAHIPEAILRPLESVNPGDLASECSGFNGEIYVICQSGIRARKAISRLEEVGCYECVPVDGGMAAWAAAGLPVERQRVRVISLERQVRIAAGFLVLAGTLLGTIVHPAILVIPGFIGAGLMYAGISDKCGMAILLARMPWNQLHSKANETGCACAR